MGSTGSPSVVHFVGRAYAHHGSRSGYARLVDHVPGDVRTQLVDGSEGRALPSRLCSWMARRSANAWYTSASFRMEFDAGLRLLRTRHAVSHVLYADDSLRYLGEGRIVRTVNRNRIVGTYHQPPEVLNRLVDRGRVPRSVDAIILLGSNQVPYFEPLLRSDRVVLVPHGIDTQFFSPGDEVRSGRTCLFVGDWLRDFATLRAVVNRVLATDPDIMFRLVTSNPDAEALAEVGNVTVLRSLSDAELRREYRSADVLVLPYLDVVASNAILEGLACGLPVVTTDVGAMTDYVSSRCGWLIDRGDAPAMSDAVVELIHDDRRRLEMGANARRTALGFDWRKVAAMHVDLYRRVAA
jgi:glycosyltransferase involved in cell wall biosynthesis